MGPSILAFMTHTVAKEHQHLRECAQQNTRFSYETNTSRHTKGRGQTDRQTNLDSYKHTLNAQLGSLLVYDSSTPATQTLHCPQAPDLA